MGFLSATGRLLLATFFLLSAWREFIEFGTDGGPPAIALKPKVELLRDRVHTTLGVHVPTIEIKHVVAAGIALKGIGGILFILGTSVGALLLQLHLATSVPLRHDFSRYRDPEFLLSIGQDVALFGALLFYIEMKDIILRMQSKRRPPKPKAS